MNMRFKIVKKYPLFGSIRKKSFFAIFPVKIGNELRIFERVNIEQHCVHAQSWTGASTILKWKNYKFLD